MVSVVDPMRVAAISASARSRWRLSSREAMSCCQARYAPPAAGTARLFGIRKLVAKPSATVFISPDLPSLSTSFVRMTFTSWVFLLWASRRSTGSGRRTFAPDPSAQAGLQAGLGDGVGGDSDGAGDAPHCATDR